MLRLKVCKVGDSLGLTLPEEALNHMEIEEGDQVVLTETSEGYALSSYDPKVARQMQAGENGMRAYRNTLKALAK